ncbi:CU044_2847 family protein [Actinoplanes sp. NPDC004185]
MSSEVVRYRVDDETVAQFEIEPVEGFRPAGAGDIAGSIKDSAGPALAAARELLEQVREMAPDAVEVKFGIKVTGTANWVVAKAATEANFEVTMIWQPRGLERRS